jgi:hypothetical protein
VSTRSEQFFQSVVEPTVREYLNDLGNVRRGRLAAIVLNHMADYWVVDEGTMSAQKLRTLLTKECPLFSVIRDITDATKHAQVSRENRVLSDEGQLSRPPGLFQAPFGTGLFAEASVATVTLDDGQQLPLEDAVRAVLSIWEAKLRDRSAGSS